MAAQRDRRSPASVHSTSRCRGLANLAALLVLLLELAKFPDISISSARVVNELKKVRRLAFWHSAGVTRRYDSGLNKQSMMDMYKLTSINNGYTLVIAPSPSDQSPFPSVLYSFSFNIHPSMTDPHHNPINAQRCSMLSARIRISYHIIFIRYSSLGSVAKRVDDARIVHTGGKFDIDKKVANQ
jgi:hypothetical protein